MVQRDKGMRARWLGKLEQRKYCSGKTRCRPSPKQLIDDEDFASLRANVLGSRLCAVTPISRTTFQPEKESEMPTPTPPYQAAFCQQFIELVHAGRGVGNLARGFGCIVSGHTWLEAVGM